MSVVHCCPRLFILFLNMLIFLRQGVVSPPPPPPTPSLVDHSLSADPDCFFNIQTVLDFQNFDFRTTRTFVHYKFSPLIRLSDAAFGLSYTAYEQKFLVMAQWRCKTEFRNVFCVYWMQERPIPVAVRSKAWVCVRLLAEMAVSNPAGGMDVCLLWLLCVAM